MYRYIAVVALALVAALSAILNKPVEIVDEVPANSSGVDGEGSDQRVASGDVYGSRFESSLGREPLFDSDVVVERSAQAASACLRPTESLVSTDRLPASIIFDTDFGPDVDDAGALAVLHALADRGEAEILGVMLSTTEDSNGPGAVAAVNAYYQRPEIPIGLADPGALTFPSKYTEQIGSEIATESVAELPATALYRKLLASQPDGSVTIVSVGFTSNLDDLLLSQPDEYSELHGDELVAQKVRLWVAMAGHFPDSAEHPKGAEYNMVKDIRASVVSTTLWPTPVVFTGFEVGSVIHTGGVLQEGAPADNPVREAYRLYTGGEDRESWDLTAVWYAVLGPGEFFDVCAGRIEVFADGSNGWDTSEAGHAYLKMKVSPTVIARALDDLLLAPPRRTAAAPEATYVGP